MVTLTKERCFQLELIAYLFVCPRALLPSLHSPRRPYIKAQDRVQESETLQKAESDKKAEVTAGAEDADQAWKEFKVGWEVCVKVQQQQQATL